MTSNKDAEGFGYVLLFVGFLAMLFSVAILVGTGNWLMVFPFLVGVAVCVAGGFYIWLSKEG